MTPPSQPIDPHDDSIDYALGFGKMIYELMPYWHRQDSMPPEQALRKLLNEHAVMLEVLSDMAAGVEAMESYDVWAKRVVEGIR